jgi:hypothetical protein
MPPQQKPGPHFHLPVGSVRVESYPDLQSAWLAMRRDEAVANSHVTVEQGLIGWGDYFEIPADLNMGVHAWGHVMDRHVVEESERAAGADETEIRYTMANMDSAYARGYRFSWTYSAYYPEGELGSVHISKMVKVTPKRYAQAQQDGWA